MLNIILRFFLIFFISITFLLVNSRAASSQTSQSEQDTYVLLSGKQRGVQIFTIKDSTIVARELNSSTNALGEIKNPDPTCIGKHFHGSLFVKNDPAKTKCGWGNVSKINNTSANLQLLSNSIQFLIVSRQKIEENNNSQSIYSSASLGVSLATSNLHLLLGNVEANSQKLKKADLKLLRKNIQCGIDNDRNSKDILDKLVNGLLDVSEESKAISNINSALSCKKQIVKILLAYKL